MKGLTSKEHLFLRVISVVTLINAVAFYNVARYMQTFVNNFFETITLITALTLFVLAVNLEFWWRYLRRTDNQRFWVSDFQALRVGHKKGTHGLLCACNGGKRQSTSTDNRLDLNRSFQKDLASSPT